MKSNALKYTLTAALAVPLMAEKPLNQAVSGTRNAVASSVLKVSEADAEKIEYLVKGNQRILRARGKNLEALYNAVTRAFIEKIRKEIQNPENHFTLSQFGVDGYEEKGELVLELGIKLNPAPSMREAEREVAIAGAVAQGPTAGAIVSERIRREMPVWQNRTMRLSPETDFSFKSASINSESLSFHAVMAAGVPKLR